MPSRSAVLGVLGAGLGLDRHDQDNQGALVTGYRMAVRLDAPGSGMTDYHTVQTVAATKVKAAKPATRAELMAFFKNWERETILSRREYRQNSVTTVAMWTLSGARWSLDELAQALRTPVFTLYAGRKCNPFGLPLNPDVQAFSTLAEAFASRRPLPAGLDPKLQNLLRPRAGWGREVAHDSCEGFLSGLQPLRRELRRDVPVDRGPRWLFEPRLVEYGRLPEEVSA